ncbi:MAG: hypothetical protein BAA02_01670 [Paenibacillaceae bacterium ZCTH02-B3]|nr:MAG: hypothetical protein BAA02_01670 [Paenibacillaceae bacterium ZCTH02-B3]
MKDSAGWPMRRKPMDNPDSKQTKDGMKRMSRKWFLVALVATLLVPGAAACAPKDREASPEEEGKNGRFTLTVLHTANMHGNVDPAGQLARFVKDAKAAGPALYLDAGDMFKGNPVVDILRGKPMIDLMNDAGLDAMTVGNLDFDYGQEQFARNMADSRFPWLSANMEVADPSIPIRQPQPYALFEFDGVKVGVLGITEAPPETRRSGIVGLEFRDYASTVERFASLRGEADILIALTHIGDEEDRRLAERFDLFDLIVSGSGETPPGGPEVVNGTPIVRAGADLRYIGVVKLELDRATGQTKLADSRLQPTAELKETDAAVRDKAEGYKKELEAFLSEVIGRTATGLSAEGLYEKDVPVGNFWTDAMRDAYNAEIAFTNNGGIRNEIAPGDMTVGDIHRIEPFQNRVMIVEMTGKALRDVIEYSYTRQGRNRVDLQTSGLHYVIVTDGSGAFRSAELAIGGQPVDPDRVYRVAVPDFLGTGGDGYRFEGRVVDEDAGVLTDALIQYAKKLTREKGSVDYGSEGRIRIRTEG